MEFLSPLIGLIGMGVNASSQAASQEIAMENLMFQKQQAAKQERLSTATRVDAFGNKQQYNPATNTWENILTPTQKNITQAGEQEQLKSLTVDALRKRQLAQRQEQRSLAAEPLYNDAIQGYRYDQPHSEAADRGELEQLMILSNEQRGKGNQADLVKQALRLGRGADIPTLIKATDDNTGNSVVDALLKARGAAQQQHLAETQAHDARYLPEISKFQSIIDDGGGNSEQRFSNVPQQMDQMQASAMAGALGALNNGSSNINAASKAFATAVGKPLDFGGLAKSFGGAAGKQGKEKTTTGSKSSGDTQSGGEDGEDPNTVDEDTMSSLSWPWNMQMQANPQTEFLF